MGTVQKSLRIQVETARAIEELGSEAGVEFSVAANELLEEAVRMRRCPGIVFTSGPSGRRATVAGTGVDVWEIIASDRHLGDNRKALARAYHWLSEPQLRAALAYYALYPTEIDARLEREARLTPPAIAKRHPSLSRRGSGQARRRR